MSQFDLHLHGVLFRQCSHFSEKWASMNWRNGDSTEIGEAASAMLLGRRSSFATCV